MATMYNQTSYHLLMRPLVRKQLYFRPLTHNNQVSLHHHSHSYKQEDCRLASSTHCFVSAFPPTPQPHRAAPILAQDHCSVESAIENQLLQDFNQHKKVERFIAQSS